MSPSFGILRDASNAVRWGHVFGLKTFRLVVAEDAWIIDKPGVEAVTNRAETDTTMTVETQKRVRAKPELRREQILDEAMRLMGQRGYYGFTIRELAHRCQLTNPGLLHHFGSKETLLVAVLEQWEQRETEVVKSIGGMRHQRPDRDGFALSDVLNALHALILRVSAQPEMMRLDLVLQVEAINETHPAYSYFQTRQARIREEIANYLAPYVPEPRSTARQVIALLFGLEQQWLQSAQTFDLVGEWDRAVAVLLLRSDESSRG